MRIENAETERDSIGDEMYKEGGNNNHPTDRAVNAAIAAAAVAAFVAHLNALSCIVDGELKGAFCS